ncbi:MAG: endonuclease MutS2 [Candidatus Desulforudis sp.]|nr:endonuclease MutS2 [Desulforudis sp.]
MTIASEKVLVRLEFDKILEQLARHTVSPLGRERALALRAVDDLDLVRTWQAETEEGSNLFRLDPNADFGGWHDIREPVERAVRGLVLEGETLFQIGQTLGAVRIQKKFLAERRDRYPLLAARAATVLDFPEPEQKIKKCILPGGEVTDGASAKLADVRRRLQAARAKVRETLERLVRSPAQQKYLQEPIITIRQGRYVVPVKIEYRNQVPGLVHDQSASGATLFVEPLTVVDKNNEIRRLESAEKQEIQKILAELSSAVARVAPDVLHAVDLLGYLDFVLGKARLSRQQGAVPPRVDRGAYLAFRKARHPLIRENVVAIDGGLGRDFDLLVLTGPNAGGKTVALKTFGLLVLMTQAGLHVPASECAVGLFSDVFADIGDEQSIENSLSTFSSHVANLVEIVGRVGPASLVLIDELGTGTDPTEGAALAQAILEELHRRRVRGVATTHYGELKQFASGRDRVENASVEFDVDTLEPSFRLVTGRPGRSYAFEIALRLGMPEAVVYRAREFLSDDQREAARLLQQLEKTQQEAERLREAAREAAREADDLRRRYESELADLLEKKSALRERAAREAQELVRQARRETEAVIRDLRESMHADSNRVREQAIQEARRRIGRLGAGLPVADVPETAAGVPEALESGEQVFIPRYGQRGVTLGPSRDGEVQVQVGAVKVSLPLVEVRRTTPAPVAQPAGSNVMLEKTREVGLELDLRGLRTEEALNELEKYLDDAALAGLPRVHLIHGMGTGALRSAVHSFLKADGRIRSFRLGGRGEGGLGVTVVEF